MKYYADINDAPVSDLLIQASIKTENHLMYFYNSSWQDCPYTGRSTGAYIIFYQGGPIDHVRHMFQDQFLNQVNKVSTMQHALQELL